MRAAIQQQAGKALRWGLCQMGCGPRVQRAPVQNLGTRYKVFYHTSLPLKGRGKETAWFKSEARAEAALRLIEAKYGRGVAVIFVD